MLLLTLITLAFTQLVFTYPQFEVNPYVVNGTDAKIEDRPYVVSIRKIKGGNDYESHHCGGSILSPIWILGVAHCSGTSVQYGTDRVSVTGDNIINIRQWIRHENYDPVTMLNDIAVIELEEALPPWSATLRPTTLPPRMFELPLGNFETKVTLVGFGLNETGGSYQTHLQQVELLVASFEYCSSVHDKPIHVSNICAGVPEGGKGQCTGDSGGPLTMDNGWQIGMPSWSEKPCTIAPYPGVYTKVSHFIDWIEDNTGLVIP